MALTRDFKETIKERADNDPEFRVALLTEAVNCLLEGDLETGKRVIRDYINATVGFVELANLTGKDRKSLMRMFSDKGKPTAENLFLVIQKLQQNEGVLLTVTTGKQKRAALKA